jgi:hypothetical protein
MPRRQCPPPALARLAGQRRRVSRAGRDGRVLSPASRMRSASGMPPASRVQHNRSQHNRSQASRRVNRPTRGRGGPGQVGAGTVRLSPLAGARPARPPPGRPAGPRSNRLPHPLLRRSDGGLGTRADDLRPLVRIRRRPRPTGRHQQRLRLRLRPLPRHRRRRAASRQRPNRHGPSRRGPSRRGPSRHGLSLAASGPLGRSQAPPESHDRSPRARPCLQHGLGITRRATSRSPGWTHGSWRLHCSGCGTRS